MTTLPPLRKKFGAFQRKGLSKYLYHIFTILTVTEVCNISKQTNFFIKHIKNAST